MVWNPGDGDDLNEGGDGNDTVEVNGGNGGEQFTVQPSEVPGRVLFDRTGPTPPGPFNLDIGTSERIDLNANGGDDTLAVAQAPLATTLDVDGGDGDDVLRGSRGGDKIAGGAGDDVIRTKDKSADSVDCGPGFDFARVDKRDSVTGCNVVIGGKLKVRVGAVALDRGAAVLRLRCVATDRCRGMVRLRRGSKSLGKARFTLRRGQAKRVRVKLNRRGRALVAAAGPKGARAKVRIDSHDSSGNGWRSTARIRLKR
jgi:Ca2+-binding RTX toxin-like protein